MGGMRSAAWKRTLSQPATRLALVAGLVIALVIGQFVLLVGGGAAADREALNAASDSIEYLADISQERVLNSMGDVDHAVRDTTRYVRLYGPNSPELLYYMQFELASTEAADSLSVTYANGDFIELRPATTRFGEYQSYTVTYGEGTVSQRTVSVYDADLEMVSTNVSTLSFGTTRTAAYLAATTSSALAWTGPVLDPVSDTEVVRASLATRDSAGTVVAVVAADLAIAPLQNSLSTLPTGADGAISVQASDGTVVASPGRTPGPPCSSRRVPKRSVSVADTRPSTGTLATTASTGWWR